MIRPVSPAIPPLLVRVLVCVLALGLLTACNPRTQLDDDNLLKGAATQAMQNLNTAFGFDELTSIPLEWK